MLVQAASCSAIFDPLVHNAAQPSMYYVTVGWQHLVHDNLDTEWQLAADAELPTHKLQVASAAPIGVVGRPNRGGSYETGSDGAAGGPPGARRVPTGPRRARGDAVGSRMAPYINRAPIRDSRAIRRAPSCQNRVPTETRRIPI